MMRDNFTRYSKTKRPVALVVVLALLTLWVGGVAMHYCLDGLEPAVTVHFENLDGHIEHGLDSGHNDFEKQALSDNLVSKLIDLDLKPFFVVLYVLTIIASYSKVNFRQQKVPVYFSPEVLLPPLRAPPLHS